MIRLDTFPTTEIVSLVDPGHPPATAARLTCLLHSGPLADQQQLVVQIGGVVQPGVRTADQEVFTWSCGKDVEMEIRLLMRGQVRKAWRGWWKGGTTLAHIGTLTLQVFCAGQLQPAGLPTSTPGPSRISEEPPAQQNGSPTRFSEGEPMLMTSWPVLAERSPATPSPAATESAVTDPPDHRRGTTPEEDDLWRMSDQAQERAPQHEPAQRDEEDAEEEADSFEREEGEEEGIDGFEWEREGAEKRGKEEMDGFEQEEEEKREGRSPHPSASQSSAFFPVTPSRSSSSLPVQAPEGTMMATFCTSSASADPAEALARLTALLETMPAQTVLVDLRHHAPARSSRQVQAMQPLSKEALRAQYGGRYWDRGSAIQTTPRLLSRRPVRWECVVTNPESPEGVLSLMQALSRGFSLVFLDQGSSYATSARSAVLMFLQKRVANVRLGPCS